MNGSASINYAGVRDASAQLRKSSTTMSQVLDKVRQLMKDVNQEGTWQSEAAAEISAQFNSLSAKFDNFYQAIEGYSKFLEQTATLWEQNDQKIASAGSGLQS